MDRTKTIVPKCSAALEVKYKEIVSVEINKLELRKNSIIKLLQIKIVIKHETL